MVHVARPGAGGSRPARLGISIRRAAVRSSVVRNRWKRWLREAFRRHPDLAASGGDIVVSVTQPPAGRRFADVEAAFIHLWQQCGQPSSTS